TRVFWIFFSRPSSFAPSGCAAASAGTRHSRITTVITRAMVVGLLEIGTLPVPAGDMLLPSGCPRLPADHPSVLSDTTHAQVVGPIYHKSTGRGQPASAPVIEAMWESRPGARGRSDR